MALNIPAETRRIIFRALEFEDADMVLAMHQNERVTALVADGLMDTRFKAIRYITMMKSFYQQNPGLGVWIGVESGSGQALGIFSLMPLDGSTHIEYGARLLEEQWGKEYATEAGVAFLWHGFTKVNQAKIWATCRPQHRGAQVVLARLGFDFEAMRMAYGSQLAAFSITFEQHRAGITMRSRKDAVAAVKSWQSRFLLDQTAL